MTAAAGLGVGSTLTVGSGPVSSSDRSLVVLSGDRKRLSAITSFSLLALGVEGLAAVAATFFLVAVGGTDVRKAVGSLALAGAAKEGKASDDTAVGKPPPEAPAT